MTLEDLLSNAYLALEKAKSRGVETAEVYIVYSEKKGVELHNNKVNRIYTATDAGLGVRVAIGRKVGFSYTNILDENFIVKAIENAISSAKSIPEDIYWMGLPAKEATVGGDIYSPKIAYTDISKLVEVSKTMLSSAVEDKRITVVYGGSSTSVNSKVVVNSEGIEAATRSTVAGVTLELVANEAGDTTPVVFDLLFSRVEVPDYSIVVSKALEKALKSLHPVKLEKQEIPVVFTQIALEELWNFTLMLSLRADAVATKRSPFHNLLNQEIASTNLTLIDNGILPLGLYTESYDDEGVPRRSTTIIEKGILKNFIADTYWGRRMGLKSTGNAVRTSYSQSVRIGFTNLIVELGTTKPEEVINDLSYGLLVDGLQGAHSSNPESGEFSVVATPAWLIQKGEVKPVRGVMLAGNAYELLKKVYVICNNVEQKGHLVAPWIVFESIRTIQR
ncbi:MAG: TldD/PmbA family protein [Ignisphaera sp.]|uniref:TldD/PmbA family protein n=1 Tax=Ignisphaera aggregans TaxID=334771 RepID=A0A7C4NMA4_9CREN